MAAKVKKSSGLSEKQKLVLLVSAGSLVLVVGAIWGWYQFTTVPPPNIAATPPEQVDEIVAYMGNARGYGRLPVEQQEKFFMEAFDKYARPGGETRLRFVQAMDRWSSAEREVFNNAQFEITRKKVMEQARQYNSLPPSQRAKFIDQNLAKMEQMRADFAGASRAESIGEPMKKGAPTSSDELMKILVNKTDASERAEAKPYVDAMAERVKQKQQQEQKKG